MKPEKGYTNTSNRKMHCPKRIIKISWIRRSFEYIPKINDFSGNNIQEA